MVQSQSSTGVPQPVVANSGRKSTSPGYHPSLRIDSPNPVAETAPILQHLTESPFSQQQYVGTYSQQQHLPQQLIFTGSQSQSHPSMESPFFRSRWGYPNHPYDWSSHYDRSSREIYEQWQPHAPTFKTENAPVRFVGSERSRSDSALKIQKVLRAFLVRKSVKKIIAMRREVNEIEKSLLDTEVVELIQSNVKEKLKVEETLTNLLFASLRSYDSRVRDCWTIIQKVIGLQRRFDAIVSGDETVDISNFAPTEENDNSAGIAISKNVKNDSADFVDGDPLEDEGIYSEEEVFRSNENFLKTHGYSFIRGPLQKNFMVELPGLFRSLADGERGIGNTSQKTSSSDAFDGWKEGFTHGISKSQTTTEHGERTIPGEQILERKLDFGSSTVIMVSSYNVLIFKILNYKSTRKKLYYNQVQPTVYSEHRRKAVIDYVQRLIRYCIGCEVFAFGSVPLKTYLPDCDIDLTVFGGINVEEALANKVFSVLDSEDKNGAAEFVVKDVKLIHAEVKLVKCLIQNVVVDFSFNQLGGLCTLCFLEQVDRLVGKDHLFKRSTVLIKAWCYYESRILGAYHGLILTYALETLVLYIFHFFHSTLNVPLEVLFRFLDYFSKFDWDKFCISLNGPVRISLLPEIFAELPKNRGDDLLLSNDFLANCVETFSVPAKGCEPNMRACSLEHLNIFDPLKENNNLGRSVSKGNFSRIRSALAFGAGKLGSFLSQSEENVKDEVCMFFCNTLDRHGCGQRPDVQNCDPSSRWSGLGSPVSLHIQVSLWGNTGKGTAVILMLRPQKMKITLARPCFPGILNSWQLQLWPLQLVQLPFCTAY